MDRAMSHPDLSIVPNAVHRVARRIDDLGSKSEALVAKTELYATDQVGDPDLADALREFVSEWNQQVRSSSGHFTDLASSLDEIAQSYRDVDTEVADELGSSSRSEGPS